MPFGTSYIIKTIRLLALEDFAINKACQALGGFEQAQLMQEATLFESFRLGVRFSSEPPPSLTAPWPYLPERGHEPTDNPRLDLDARHGGGAHVLGREPRGRERNALHRGLDARVHHRGAHAGSEKEAREVRSALQAIRLPPRYRYRPGRVASRA